MKALAIDTARRDNFKITFDEPVDSLGATRYLAEIYQIVSPDTAVTVGRAPDIVRDDDGRYVILERTPEGYLGRALFEIGVPRKEEPRVDHYVGRFGARIEERESLIRELERLCSGEGPEK